MSMRYWKRWAGVGVLAVGAQLAVQVVTAAPAAAVPGLTRIVSTSSMSSSGSRTAAAFCPSGTRLYGGGGSISDGFSGQVFLTTLEPILATPENGFSNDFFWVTATETAAGFAGTWSLTAYAICGSAPSGLVKVSASTASSSAAFQGTLAACPSGKRALSAGGTVFDAFSGRVGLHLVRPDGPLTIGRATAHEIASGYSLNWTVTAHALCANAIPGLQNVAQVSNSAGFGANCPAGTRAHGVGGGGGTFDSGPFFLSMVIPSSTLSGSTVIMTGTPLNGGMVAQATCAT